MNWQFDRPKEVTKDQLEDRKKKMKEFLEDPLNADTVALVPKVRAIFVPATKKRPWSELRRATRRATTSLIRRSKNKLGGDS